MRELEGERRDVEREKRREENRQERTYILESERYRERGLKRGEQKVVRSRAGDSSRKI